MKINKGIVGTALCLCILCGNYALAKNHEFKSFTVARKEATYITSAEKSDNEQRWYVTIDSFKITKDDKLYFNVRDAKYGTRLSKALSFTGATAKSTKYTTKTKQGQSIFLHSQLESSAWTPDSFAHISKGRWCP